MGTSRARRGFRIEGDPFGPAAAAPRLDTRALVGRRRRIERLLDADDLVVIADADGAGKSTMIDALLRRLATQRTVCRLDVGPALGPGLLLRCLARRLAGPAGSSPAACVRALDERARREGEGARPLLVVVDDAHRLTAGAVALLSALALRWRSHGARFLLAGRPELLLTLADAAPVRLDAGLL